MSASVNEICIRTPLAAVAKDDHIRVYQLDVEGKVREAQYEGKWMGGKSDNAIGQARFDSPLAATSLGLEHIRVYAIGNDSTLKEFAYDSGSNWQEGSMSGQFKVAPYSSVAAVFLARKVILRVYAQKHDNTIQEYCYDNNKWQEGHNLGEAMPGTDITAISMGEDEKSIKIRVYFQDTKKHIIEQAYDASGSKWYTGHLTFKSDVTRASLGAVQFEGTDIRVYYGCPDNHIREKVYSDGKWTDGNFDQDALAATNVAATCIGGNQLRCYMQVGHQFTATTEFAWDGKKWHVGREALPPA